MPEQLTAAARHRHATTRARAEAALLALVSSGDRITFAAVARRAKVSTDFLYNQPDLREKIITLRVRRPQSPTSLDQQSEINYQQTATSSAVRALSSQIKDLKRQHAEAIRELRAALSVAQGENLELRRRLSSSK